MTKIEELKSKLNDLCEKTNTRKSGLDYLIGYYITSLGWSEEYALEYAIDLFKNGTISEIKLFGKNGEELWDKKS